MRRIIDVPEGYEASLCWIDGARSWRAYFREIGAQWWAQTMLFGHAHTPETVLFAEGARLVRESIKIHERPCNDPDAEVNLCSGDDADHDYPLA